MGQVYHAVAGGVRVCGPSWWCLAWAKEQAGAGKVAEVFKKRPEDRDGPGRLVLRVVAERVA